MARKPKSKSDIDQDDWVWLLTRVTLDREVDGVRHLTLELPNGHRETVVYNPDQVKKADME
jgi:hypothetical protein